MGCRDIMSWSVACWGRKKSTSCAFVVGSPGVRAGGPLRVVESCSSIGVIKKIIIRGHHVLLNISIISPRVVVRFLHLVRGSGCHGCSLIRGGCFWDNVDGRRCCGGNDACV